MNSAWCLIESSPEVFTQLLTELGVKGAQVEELWSLEKESLKYFGEIYGLIFLFKWRQFEGEKRRPMETWPEEVYFANQVIENACATQAILSIVLNRPELDIGEDLAYFKEFTREFSALTKGLAMSNSEVIRTVHNSFASSLYAPENAQPQVEVTETEETQTKQTGSKAKRKRKEDESEEEQDAYHFISYVPINGTLYELDGLKAGPIDLGPCTMDNWLDVCIPLLQRRMQWFNTEEIQFNCMAVLKEKLTGFQAKLDRAKEMKALIDHHLKEILRIDKNESEATQSFEKVMESTDWRDFSDETKSMPTSNAIFIPLPEIDSITDPVTSVEQRTMQCAHLNALLQVQIRELQSNIESEIKRSEEFALDRQRRNFDYKPFISKYLEILAKKAKRSALK